jgi:hypothetical protein
MGMGWKIASCVIACALLAPSCTPTDESSKVVTIRGKVTTGAHARTALVRGYVDVLGPQGPNAGHWIGYSDGVSPGSYTHDDGTYVFKIGVRGIKTSTKGFPFFIAVSDEAQTFTMLAEIPADLVAEGAELTLDINPATTAASLMICPGGAFPPPANTWCYSDPNTASTASTELVDIIEDALAGTLISVETGTPPAWSSFVGSIVSDPPTFELIKKNLTARGINLGSADPALFSTEMAALPIVKPGKPTSSSSSSSSSGGGGSCKLVWDCGASTQCASAYGGSATGSASEPDAETCASVCKQQGACTCQGC